MFTRYAIYFTPEGALAEFGARWLGWDLEAGASLAHPEVPGVDVEAVPRTPRKYGLHATIKPPFRLAEGHSAAELEAAAAAFCASQPAVELDGLQFARIGRFLALVPEGDVSALAALAGDAVRAFDPFRAPASDAELAKRRARGLSPAQEANLVAWGYPYVFDEFRFHITLSGSLEPALLAEAEAALAARLTGHLPRPFRIGTLSLAGERPDGQFQLIQRHPLAG